MEISDRVGLEAATWVVLFAELGPGYGKRYVLSMHLGARRTARGAKW